jgi:trehalose/maltose transport system permease protein
VVSAQMWNWMYQDSLGIVSSWGRYFGLLKVGQSLVANPNTALWALVAVDVWKTTPFMALLLLAGLQTIPPELYEASHVDGATRLQQFRRITLPLLAPALLVAVIFRTLDALRMYDLPQILTGGANGTTTSSILVVRQLTSGINSASALSTITFVFIFVIAFGMVRLFNANIIGAQAKGVR